MRSAESNRLQPPGSRSLGVAGIESVPLFRDGLCALIHRTQGLHWVGHATNHHGALHLEDQLHPNIMLIDSGLDPHCHLIKLLAAGDSNLLIVILVREAHRDPAYLTMALAAGAHGALPRSTDSQHLVEAIHRTYVDRQYVDPALAGFTLPAKRQPPRPRGTTLTGPSLPLARAMPLSRREYQVLQLIAEGLENSAIAKLLYLSVETVRTHVKSILRKLSARDRTHAVTTAFRQGILIMQPEDALTPDLPLSRAAAPSS